MVARNSLAFSIEKCDGHGLRGLTATGKKDPRHQDSSHDQMSEAMGCKPSPFRAVHTRLIALIRMKTEYFPTFVTLGISD